MSELILCEKKGAVTTIILNRPDIGNLMTNEMAVVLAGMLDSAADSHVVVLRGAGKDFCLGRDLTAPASPPTALDVRHSNTEPVLKLYRAFRHVSAPVVGLVTGGAIGLGCALAAACDITLASDDARFQLPEMDHGIPPCLAMSALINRVPLKAIAHLVYSTEVLIAAEALALGLVSKVYPARELHTNAGSFIDSLVGRPLPAVRAVKEYLRSAPAMDPQGMADFASNLLANVMSSRRPAKH